MVFPPPLFLSFLFLVYSWSFLSCLSIRQWSRPACVAVSSFRGLGSRLLCCPFSCLHFLSIFNLSSRESFIPAFLAFHPFRFEARIKQEQEMDTVMLLSPCKCYHHVHAFRRSIPPSPFTTDLVNSHPSTLKSPKLPNIPSSSCFRSKKKKRNNRTQLRPSPPDPMRPNGFQCFRDAHLKNPVYPRRYQSPQSPKPCNAELPL